MASSVIKRYGKAILDIAEEKNNKDIWIDNFRNSKDVMSDEDLKSFLISPEVPNSEKYKSINTLFAGFDKLFINFLKVLITKGQVNFYEGIMNEFFDQNQISEGKVSATITSFVDLSKEQEVEIIKKICEVFEVDDVDINKKIRQIYSWGIHHKSGGYYYRLLH
jgi:ATP synthase F1 delta subunit